jgi:hypothetical protein
MEAGPARPGDDQLIVDTDAERLGCFGHALGRRDVAFAWMGRT